MLDVEGSNPFARSVSSPLVSRENAGGTTFQGRPIELRTLV